MKWTRPPKRIQVGPYNLAVHVDNNRLARHTAERGDQPDSLAGGCDVPAGQIVLRKGMAADYAAEVLLHEVLHACFVVGGDPLEKDVEEQAVSAIGPTLLDTLRRNPDLAAYLLNDGRC